MNLTARSVAAAVLTRVSQKGAFASAALEAELGAAAQLEPRDRALATEIVYGALRTMTFIESRIEKFSSRPLDRVDPKVRVHLIVAAYQMYFLTRVPKFAAVNEAVDAVNGSHGGKVGGFANAVLRKLATDAEKDPVTFGDAMAASAPAWLKDALARSLGGEEAAKAFIVSAAEPTDVGICVYDASERDAWITKLAAAHPDATFRAGEFSPHAIRAKNAGRPQDLEGFASGALTIQEEGSQLVALDLGAQPGEHVLDACAGRGNKTALLANAVGKDGAVDAADSHPKKLERLVIELGSVHLAARETFAVDWTLGLGDVIAKSYDRVLVDAPCSGTGTIRRRPEIFARRQETDLPALAALQSAILARAAQAVKPGGTLIYAVCSVLKDECEDVVAAFLEQTPEFSASPFSSALVRKIADDASSASNESALRLLPGVHGTEGYFVASFTRLVE
ncbi:MAG: transcription antitermination factor NusB [Polyangiaceae bacterium]